MKFKGVGFLSVLICLQFFFCQNLEGKVLDRIVAVVNGDLITESELEEALLPLRAQYEQTASSKRELKEKLKESREIVLEQLIEEKLLLQRAREEQVELYESEVEKMAAEIKEKFSTPEKFKAWLDTRELTEPALKEKLIKQALVRKLINKKLRPGVRISPEELKAYYEKYKEQFNEGPQVSLNYILIKGPPERKNNEAEILVRQVWGKIMEGTDFNILAKEYSEDPKSLNGGDLGFINIKTLPPELRAIVEKLEVGETSEIIRSPSGFNILKLTGRREARKRELSEVEDVIEEQIFRNKLEEKYQPWLEKLKEEAYIERKQLNGIK
ncbi:MAG: peptidylprolyl isomerase [Candidatus Ratteibacteria bacterium]|nr:peptidylprolyl isomerase [Candidatus Ratteibacteria bacterium]